MKTILALLLTTVPAWAAQIPCVVGTTNADVLAHFEKNAQETLRFVGAVGSKSENVPMEIVISDDGEWAMLVITSEGVCIAEGGVNWQAVEQKPKGTEN